MANSVTDGSRTFVQNLKTYNIDSKIALITGGSRGLGRDMALNLAKEDIHALFTYHSNIKKANTLIAEIERLFSEIANQLALKSLHLTKF